MDINRARYLNDLINRMHNGMIKVLFICHGTPVLL